MLSLSCMDQLPTSQDILEAINVFSTHVDQRFDRLEGRVDGVEGRLNKIETTMVTKDYLDDKLADLRGDLVVLLRKEDNKFGALVTELLKEEVISQDAAKRILQMEPFPHLSL